MFKIGAQIFLTCTYHYHDLHDFKYLYANFQALFQKSRVLSSSTWTMNAMVKSGLFRSTTKLVKSVESMEKSYSLGDKLFLPMTKKSGTLWRGSNLIFHSSATYTSSNKLSYFAQFASQCFSLFPLQNKM